MNNDLLIATTKALMATGKGLLAIDESTGTCNKRFAAAGIPETAEKRRDWRELIVTTPFLNEGISGVILYDETIRQATKAGIPMVNVVTDEGIIPGIKVDTGAKPMAGFPGEKITSGLDGLAERLQEYVALGARFCKWRAVFTIGNDLPTDACVDANAHTLARYAALCQQAGMVPVVEPEILMAGSHDLQRCAAVTEAVLRAVFIQLYRHRILPAGMILKPNMVTPGLQCDHPATVAEVAGATINCLLRSVPAAVGGIAFLSGGQPGALASAHLNAMHVNFKDRLPWPLTFSFGRAIQQPGLDSWQGRDSNTVKAQLALYHRVSCDRAALLGLYNEERERSTVLHPV